MLKLFLQDAQGGDINFTNTIAFLDNYNSEAAEANPATLENNAAADINATGTNPGEINIADTSFIQNSLTALPDNAIDTDRLLASTCINRTQQTGRFTITGTDGLPERPGNADQSTYPTGTIQPLSESGSSSSRPWQMGDAIEEPQGVYQLADGRLAMGRECPLEP